MEMEKKVSSMTVTSGKSDLLADETLPKARKPYTITKQREKWTEEEHKKFLEALQLHGRNWRRIEEHIGTKTTIQIRSHAQKFFSKVVRESSNNNNTSNVAPIHIPPPRPKRKPTRPYPRKLGSIVSDKQSISISAMRKAEKASLKGMAVEQQENGSPTSVLNGCASPVGSVVGSNEQDNVAQLSGSSGDGDERIRCTSPHTAVADSAGKLASPEESAQKSEVHTSATPEEDMCVESFSPSLKLFGKTVAVKSVSSHQTNTGNNSSSDESMVTIDHENNPIGLFLPNNEASWNSWHTGMLPFFYYMPPLPGDNMSHVTAHLHPLWSPYGVMPYPHVNPENGDINSHCLNSDNNNTVSNEMRRLGSFTGSSCVSNGDPVESGKSIKKIDSLVIISRSKECDDDKPVRGFVPYKRCISETQKIKVIAEDGESELTRLCL